MKIGSEQFVLSRKASFLNQQIIHFVISKSAECIREYCKTINPDISSELLLIP